jgi:hypothetical protein
MVLHGLAGYFETVLYTPPAAEQPEVASASPPGLGQATPVSPPYLPPPPPGIPAIILSGHITSGNSNESVSADAAQAPASAAVTLSTVPQTHTADMYSWFPLFIPLSQPVRVRAGETITAHVWR